MTDAHAKAVEAAGDAYRYAASDYDKEPDPIAAAIAAYLAAMRAERWVMVRDCGAKVVNGPRSEGWNACRAAMLKGDGDGQG